LLVSLLKFVAPLFEAFGNSPPLHNLIPILDRSFPSNKIDLLEGCKHSMLAFEL